MIVFSYLRKMRIRIIHATISNFRIRWIYVCERIMCECWSCELVHFYRCDIHDHTKEFSVRHPSFVEKRPKRSENDFFPFNKLNAMAHLPVRLASILARNVPKTAAQVNFTKKIKIFPIQLHKKEICPSNTGRMTCADKRMWYWERKMRFYQLTNIAISIRQWSAKWPTWFDLMNRFDWDSCDCNFRERWPCEKEYVSYATIYM